jgi:hypothetical protein
MSGPDFEGDALEQLTGFHDAGGPTEFLRKVPPVAGDNKLRLRNFRAMQEFSIIDVGQDRRGTDGPSKAPISSGVKANFGRASTSLYSVSISAE